MAQMLILNIAGTDAQNAVHLFGYIFKLFSKIQLQYHVNKPISWYPWILTSGVVGVIIGRMNR